MMNKFYPLALSAMLGIGAFAVPSGGVSAAAIPAVQQFAGSGVSSGGSDLVQDVAMRRKDERKWNKNRHGNRYRNRRGNYRHYHDGYYYQTPWWSLAVPLVIGGALAASDNYGSDHVEWCSDRYRSYNPNDNSWVSYSGEVRECNSPY